MADTSLLGKDVEDFVRRALAKKYGQLFAKEKLRLSSGGLFNFDAVSKDHKIVACVKSSRGLTRTGRPATGAEKAAIADIYFLSLVDASRRFLVLTDGRFYARMHIVLKGRIVQGVEIVHLPLLPALARKTNATLDRASQEMRSRVELHRGRSRTKSR